MADFDFEPPSFSLGLDLDADSEPQPATPADPLFEQASSSFPAVNLPTIEEYDEDGFQSPVRVSDRPQSLKRLRRGLASEAKKVGSEDERCNVDDEIEDFSSEEDLPKGNLPPNSICGSSKASLHGHKFVTSETGSHWKSGKGKEVSSASASANVETKGRSLKFPKLTISPLKRFQLIDSDSDPDDPSVIEDSRKGVPCVILSPKGKQLDSGLRADKVSVGNFQNEDLWKDFCSEKSFPIHTPAFDEVCEEYFKNIKEKRTVQSDHHKDPNSERKLGETCVPPAHRYFFHNDSRIQKLVRDRLPYFFPLVGGNNLEHKLQNASVIDYMGQFGQEGNSGQINRRPMVKKSSTRNKKNVRKSQAENVSEESSGWVNPKSCAGTPKNASNRRVQAASNAAGTSAGHWYTDSNGRKVYVNKNGQELTGQIAYRHYRKESGKGIKNSKKKTGAKRKAGWKKK